MKKTMFSMCLLLSVSSLFAREYHVSPSGNDAANGSVETPLRTINRAAQLALPGDTVTVHQGTYREWIDPLNGGESNTKRILYRAAEDEKVEIKGSELVTGWKREKKNKQVWKVVLPNRFFGNYNPFNDRLYGDWLWSDKIHHTADVYLNDGKGNFTLADIDLPGVSEGSIELADFANSGKNDILISGNCNGGFNGHTSDRRIAVLCKNTIDKVNTSPNVPDGLSAIVNGNSVELKWNASTDKESSQNSLSYNFYIRDLNTGLFLTSPDADITNGMRHVSRMGNAWTNCRWTLHDLPVGEYAWSVQAIDAGYKGSMFAPEQTFTVTDPDGIKETTASVDNLLVTVVDKGVNLKLKKPQKIAISSIDGKCVFVKFLEKGSYDISLSSGFYLVNSKKVIVK